MNSSLKTKNDQSSIIKKNKENCIWMDLGVVSYKICDRNFECESCPLDLGLRARDTNTSKNHPIQKYQQSNNQPAFQLKRESSLYQLLQFKLDGKYYVNPGHSWIKIINQNLVKIGVDDMVSATLGMIDEIILPLPGEEITRGSSCGQIVQFEQIFSIVSPLSGRVLSINENLQKLPNDIIFDPLKKGWMLKIRPSNLDLDLKFCRYGDALYSWYLKEFKWFESNLTIGFQQRMPNLGTTLNDGSEISRNLRNYLPKEQYRRLVINLLGIPEPIQQ